MKKQLYCLILVTFLSGCYFGPHYRPPENCIPEGWNTCVNCLQEEPPLTAWWQALCDPLLDKYIGLAACNNFNILSLEANILRARALQQVAASKLFPQVFADFNATRTYFSKNGPVFALQSLSETSPTTGLPFQLQIPQIQNLFNALLDASWEIDLFGKTQAQIESAEARVGVAIEDKNDGLLSLIAEVAINYIQLRAYQQQGLILEKIICLLEGYERIVRLQYEKGYRNKLDLETIEVRLATARADLPNIFALIYRNLYTISILTGELPEALQCELLPIGSLPCLPCDICLGLRSELLYRRPDVKRAERKLAAAVADIGEAVASFFPTFTLNATLGLQSLQFLKLFQAHSKTWALGGDARAPIFQGGKLVGNLKVAKASAASAIYSYQQTVLNALQEAESALIAFTQSVKAKEYLKEAVEKNQDVTSLTRKRFDKGLINVLNWMDTENQLLSAELNLLNSETEALMNLIALYKAIGGGWQLFQCY